MTATAVKLERLQLSRADNARYYAPVAICVYIAALCVGLMITSAFLVHMQDVLALTFAGLFGLLLSGALGALFWYVQRRELRYWPMSTTQDAAANFDAVLQLMHAVGWQVSAQQRPARLRAHTSGALLHEGEVVEVQFREHEVLIASICDPKVGFSVIGSRRCKLNRERIRARLAGDSAAALGAAR